MTCPLPESPNPDHDTGMNTVRVKRISAEAEHRIIAGESWLAVWCVETGTTLPAIARATGISLQRLNALAAEDDGPTETEWPLIAEALGASVGAIQAVQD